MPIQTLRDWFQPDIVSSNKRYDIQQLIHQIMESQGRDVKSLPNLKLPAPVNTPWRTERCNHRLLLILDTFLFKIDQRCREGTADFERRHFEQSRNCPRQGGVMDEERKYLRKGFLYNPSSHPAREKTRPLDINHNLPSGQSQWIHRKWWWTMSD